MRTFTPLGLLMMLFSLVGCEREIGDECASPSECTGSRLCLAATEGYPGGYCTLFNCQPDKCPEESVCVGYRTSLADSPECSDPFEQRRLERSFCMRSCSSDADCRGGYECVDVTEANPWGATLLEDDGRSGKICGLPSSYAGDVADARSSEVCESRPVPNVIDPAKVTVLTTPRDGGAAPTGDLSDAATDAGQDASAPAPDAASSASP